MKQLRASNLLYLYILAAMATIYARAANPYGDPDLLELIAKPLLMPLLGLWFLLEYRPMDAFGRLIALALVFSWAGDLLLLFTGRSDWFFMGGLGAFLIAHLAYIWAFLRFPLVQRGMTPIPHGAAPQPGPPFGALRKRPWLALPVLLYSGALIALLTPHLGAMAVPVYLYAAVISLMALAAIDRRGRVPSNSFSLVLIGALLFVASDSMIALNKFYRPFDQAGALIMLTYSVAQYLIAIGALYLCGEAMGEGE